MRAPNPFPFRGKVLVSSCLRAGALLLFVVPFVVPLQWKQHHGICASYQSFFPVRTCGVLSLSFDFLHPQPTNALPNHPSPFPFLLPPLPFLFLVPTGIWGRPLGNVVYFMASPLAAQGACAALLGALAAELEAEEGRRGGAPGAAAASGAAAVGGGGGAGGVGQEGPKKERAQPVP